MTPIPQQTSNRCPALVLFGSDPTGRPHAAWFASDDLEAAERASGDLGYAALRVANEDDQALALMLPCGQVEADGQVQVPLLPPERVQALQVLVLGIRLARVRPTSEALAPPPQPDSPALLRS